MFKFVISKICKICKFEGNDWIKTYDLIKQINFTNPYEIIDEVYTRGNITGGVRQLVFEYKYPDYREFALKHFHATLQQFR